MRLLGVIDYCWERLLAPLSLSEAGEADRLGEIIARASRMAEQERAGMTQQILREAFE